MIRTKCIEIHLREEMIFGDDDLDGHGPASQKDKDGQYLNYELTIPRKHVRSIRYSHIDTCPTGCGCSKAHPENKADGYAHKRMWHIDPKGEDKSGLIFRNIRQAYLDGYGEASRDRSTNTDNELPAPSGE